MLKLKLATEIALPTYSQVDSTYLERAFEKWRAPWDERSLTEFCLQVAGKLRMRSGSRPAELSEPVKLGVWEKRDGLSVEIGEVNEIEDVHCGLGFTAVRTRSGMVYTSGLHKYITIQQFSSIRTSVTDCYYQDSTLTGSLELASQNLICTTDSPSLPYGPFP